MCVFEFVFVSVCVSSVCQSVTAERFVCGLHVWVACVCVCVCVYVWVRMWVLCAPVWSLLRMCVFVDVCLWACQCVRVCMVRVLVSVYVCVCVVCVCVCVCQYVCVCVCVPVS